MAKLRLILEQLQRFRFFLTESNKQEFDRIIGEIEKFLSANQKP